MLEKTGSFHAAYFAPIRHVGVVISEEKVMVELALWVEELSICPISDADSWVILVECVWSGMPYHCLGHGLSYCCETAV